MMRDRFEPGFSTNDPAFLNIPTISGESIVSASTANTQLETLACWFREHPHTCEFMYFYVCPPPTGPQMREKRAQAIKAQIGKGLDLVMRLEEACAVKEARVFEKSCHPFPELKDLQKARELWQKVCANDLMTFKLQRKIDYIVERRATGLKMITAALLSLLASIGAVPENYIPIVQFDKLDLSDELIASKDPKCQVIQQRTVCYQRRNMMVYKEMTEIEGRYAVVEVPGAVSTAHIEQFAALIESFKKEYDLENKCMKASCDSSDFLDFLLHPNCLVASVVKNLMATKNPATYARLIKDTIAVYEVQSDLDLLIALFSNSIVTKLSPLPTELGDAKSVYLERLLELYVEHDPIRFLVLLSDLLSKGERKSVFRCVADGFASFCGNYRAIFRYVADFVLEDFLTEKLQATRQMIVEFLASAQ